MTNPILSIIVPVYNVEKYISTCIDSITSQILPRIEIVMINDGSKDGSLAICEEYANRYSFIKLITQENKGLSEARNTGIRNAEGKYLLFLDSDDYLVEGTLSILIASINKEECDFFMGRCVSFYGNYENKKLEQVDYNQIKYSTPIECLECLNSIDDFWFAAWLVIIRRDFLLKNNLYFKSGILHEDELWVPSVFVKACSMSLLNVGFYGYRTNRPDSIVSAPNIKREFDKLTIIEEFNRLKAERKEADKLLSSRQAALVFGIIISLKNFKDNPKINDLKKGITKKLYLLKGWKYCVIRIGCSLFGLSAMSSILNRIL